MCGIVGIHFPGSKDEISQQLLKMSGAIKHRGPDAEGFWVDERACLGFAHRRLSILDLSPSGNQPMQSSSGRYMVSFNGEIYNFQALRDELETAGFTFRSTSDTEVLLASIEHWGLEAALSRFVGMFAFALWDATSQSVYLVRDRVGKKPLYYTTGNKRWGFASELKALTASNQFHFDISIEALSLYMRYGYIPAPLSIYQNVYKVAPGCIVEINPAFESPRTICYWDVNTVALAGLQNPSRQTEEEIGEELDLLLADAVKLRMVADVPVGAFLSGGIDSSTVVALMRQFSTSKIKTYTIGFNEEAYNEARYAKEVANHFGTEHRELYLTENDLLSKASHIAHVVDEPLADISIFPTLAVSELAASEVKVVLSGDGGDELFCGYTHYQRILSASLNRQKIPLPLRSIGGALLSGFSNKPGKLARLREIMLAESDERLCQTMMSQWQKPSAIVHGGIDADRYIQIPSAPLLHADIRNYMMLRDMQRYMVDDILHKVDRASMAVSIEARAPLLDHRVLEYAWKIPLAAKFRDGRGKRPLRAVLDKYLPTHLYDRPKKGFAVPISAWLRSDLREWAYALICEAPQHNLFDQRQILQLWNQHQSGRYDRGAYLWSVVLFLHWLKETQHAKHST